MRLQRMVWIGLLVLLGGASSARAQYYFGSSHRNVEITGFAGGRFFGRIDLPNSTGPYDYLRIDNNYDYGVMGDVDVVGPVQAEFMWSRQPTTLEGHDFTFGTFSPFSDVNVDTYQWSLLYQMRGPSTKLRPYIAGGVGFTHWGVPAPASLPFTNNVAFNLGGGVKYFFVRHVGVRLDFRWVPSRTTSQLGEFCDFFGCYAANVNNYAHQVQLNGGLIFRF